MRQLRQALFDAQRARGAAILRASRANTNVIDALMAANAAAVMTAREAEYGAFCERDHLSGLITRLQRELDRIGGTPRPTDMRWVGRRMPGLMRTVAELFAQPGATP